MEQVVNMNKNELWENYKNTLDFSLKQMLTSRFTRSLLLIFLEDSDLDLREWYKETKDTNILFLLNDDIKFAKSEIIGTLKEITIIDETPGETEIDKFIHSFKEFNYLKLNRSKDLIFLYTILEEYLVLIYEILCIVKIGKKRSRRYVDNGFMSDRFIKLNEMDLRYTTQDFINEFDKFRLIRNLYVHHGGRVTKHFKKETGSKLDVGQEYPITKKYLIEIIFKLRLFMIECTFRIGKKFDIPLEQILNLIHSDIAKEKQWVDKFRKEFEIF